MAEHTRTHAEMSRLELFQLGLERRREDTIASRPSSVNHSIEVLGGVSESVGVNVHFVFTFIPSLPLSESEEDSSDPRIMLMAFL